MQLSNVNEFQTYNDPYLSYLNEIQKIQKNLLPYYLYNRAVLKNIIMTLFYGSSNKNITARVTSALKETGVTVENKEINNNVKSLIESTKALSSNVFKLKKLLNLFIKKKYFFNIPGHLYITTSNYSFTSLYLKTKYKKIMFYLDGKKK
jgi:hypothetical protein